MGRIFSYLVVATVALSVGYYFALFTQTVPQVSPVATTTPSIVLAEVTTKEVKEETPAYSIDVQYPQFGIVGIDSKIEKIVTDTISEFKALPPNPPGLASSQHELTIVFGTPYIGSDIVSVKLVVSEYTGGVHANSSSKGLNFDRANAKQLTQEDALQMIGLSVQQVSVAATAQLKERLGDGFFENGADSNSENFNSFLISADKVTFIFQPYQVAAFAAGPQEVSFGRKR